MADLQTGEKRLRLSHRESRASKKRAQALVLPADFTDRVVEKLPYLDSRAGRVRISSVKTGAVANPQITEILAEVSREYIAEIQAAAAQQQ